MPLVTTTFNQKTLIRIAMVIAFVQFTNALEYMMFSPVFTFMAADFAVPVTFSGYVSGMYTSGAVLSGIIAFYWIDRCNKKHFLIANMVLLAMATLLTTFTTSFPLLLTLRFFAGLVGGTTMAVGITILINHTPADLRGKMLATVIASFSMVSIVGMPAVLFLCTLDHGDRPAARAADSRRRDTAHNIIHDDRDRTLNDIHNPHRNRRF